MDVPFISSGASSRAHYALVRKAEMAESLQASNQHIANEINAIREQFAKQVLSPKTCKEMLIVLLYCVMTRTDGNTRDFDFALTHAVTLAEAGRTISEKRIGYLFCAELMPAEHELRLMLVNTLRKDLEFSEIPRICLALDNLIALGTEDFIPAVRPRLYDLLAYNSPLVRRRALLCVRALARYDPALLDGARRSVLRRLRDPDASVVNAALIISADLPQKDDSKFQVLLSDYLLTVSTNLEGAQQQLLMRVLRMQALLKSLPDDLVNPLLTLLQLMLDSQQTVCAIFQVLQWVSPEKLLSATTHPVRCIRRLLVSEAPNDHYLFLTCVEFIDTQIWAGTLSGGSPVLESWEVKRIMGFLGSEDDLIRKKTISLLLRVDSEIVESYYSQLLRRFQSCLPEEHQRSYLVNRMLELLEMKFSEDGEEYARRFHDLLNHAEATSNKQVLEVAVECLLPLIRNSRDVFRIPCATALITIFTGEEIQLDSTARIILAALGCELCGRVPIAPQTILMKLSSELSACTLAVQEAALLSMIRISADCDDIPDQVIGSVKGLKGLSRRHIRKRCDDFLSCIQHKDDLQEVLRSATSTSLPHFAEAFTAHNIKKAQTQAHAMPSPSIARLSPGSKLRYDAYDTPPEPRSLRKRQSLDGLEKGSSRNHNRETPRDPGGTSPATEATSILPAGSLTSAVFDVEGGNRVYPSLGEGVEGDTMSMTHKGDLIAFDAPADIAPNEPKDFYADFDAALFMSLWNGLSDSDGGRGWCEFQTNQIIELLRTLDNASLSVGQPHTLPFPDDLKVLLILDNHVVTSDNTGTRAAIRMRESEEGGCLWRLRCGDAGLRSQVKRILAN